MDIISIDQLADGDIARILDESGRWLDHLRSGSEPSRKHAGRIMFSLFFENSTRTLMSFATAAHRLGASIVSLPVEQSSVQKGETLADTARTLNAMRPDALIVRHSKDGSAQRVADILDAPVINAGDGSNEHPTQALLDAATIAHRLGRVAGVKVAICGDIRHSRVARSTARLLSRLGAEVRLGGPAELLPVDAPALSVDQAIGGADVVMMLRVQRERLESDLGDAPGEYLARHGLTPERLARAAPDAVVLHPGPMNRGVEIADDVADGPRSLILRQVANGVAVRMAVLDLLVAD
jgi:aspartate carbamoyltransferase catalytic subunit